MKNIFIMFLVFANGFFLLTSGSKAMFAVNVSGLTYFGMLLNLLTIGYFTPSMFRIFRSRHEVSGD